MSITKICERAFADCNKLREVEIPNNSKLQKIGKFVFFNTAIESINIPSQVIEIEEGLFRAASNINKVIVSPSNQVFCSIDDKIIIKKSSIEKENYDSLIFGVKNIRTVIVPSSIEHICIYAFDSCKKLQRVEFSNDSKLQTIDKESFRMSSIEKIRIPSKVVLIGNGAFSYCSNLKKVVFEDDSELKIIDDDAFNVTNITCISIPAQVECIIGRAFGYCRNLQIIEFNENSKFKSVSPFSFDKKSNLILMIPKKLVNYFKF